MEQFEQSMKLDEFREIINSDEHTEHLGDYFDMVLEDDDVEQMMSFTGSNDSRHFSINGVDVSSLMDLCIVFGILWEADEEYA